MISEVEKMLRKISDYAESNINIDGETKENYVKEAFSNGTEVFGILISRMLSNYYKYKESVCCSGKSCGQIEICAQVSLSLPSDVADSTNRFGIAVCINNGIDNIKRKIYVYESKAVKFKRKIYHYDSKAVKFDFNKIKKGTNDTFELSMSDSGVFSIVSSLEKIRELCRLAANGELKDNPFFDEETINSLKAAYDYVSDKEKILEQYLERLRRNARKIYRNIYKRLVDYYYEAPYKSEYSIDVAVKIYEIDDDLRISNAQKQMIELFENSGCNEKDDQIIFLGLVQGNGKKCFLPVQKRYFRSLFVDDNLFGFDQSPSYGRSIYDKEIMEDLCFTFRRELFEKKVAGLKRERKLPNGHNDGGKNE